MPVDERDPRRRLEALADGGIVAGWAEAGGVGRAVFTVHGVTVSAFATDPRAQGGAMGAEGCDVIVAAYRAAAQGQLPIIGVWHSGGARLREGVASLDGVGRVFAAMTAASGRSLQLSLVLGAAAGGAAYGPALTDIIVLAPQARVFVTGPDVVRQVTGEDVDAATLGGPQLHMSRSGLAHVVAGSVDDGIERTRQIISLATGTRFPAPTARVTRGIRDLVPANPRIAYDVRPVIDALLDEPGEELQRAYAGSIVTVLGRLGGRTVGVVANNPAQLAGCLTGAAGEKAARFVRLCDSQGIPLVVLVDVPGYLPGMQQEHEGVVRRGAKLLHAFAATTVPRVTVILRKAYGGAYIAMNSRSLGATAVFAWPGAEVDVMNSTAAVSITKRRQLAAVSPADRVRLQAELAVEHAVATGGLGRAQELGVIDDVIEPHETRRRVIRAIAAAGDTGRGRLMNIPL
jgi:acetyl-CoA/propionyl-CoA carboxylase carboxyl transferase subunit